MKKILYNILPVGAIFALWFLFCFPYFQKGLIPFPGSYLVTFFPPWSATYAMPVKNNAMPDVITQLYPWKQLTIESFKMGQIPLWNPFSFAGSAHAANYQSAIFSPFNIVFFLFPFVDAWSVFILLQPILAGLGTYVFLRALDRSKGASLLGSIAYMFCGFMTTWMAYGTLGYAALCLPWALWAVTESFKKKSVWYVPVISLSIALSFFAGHFQISLYVLAAVMFYILFITLSTGRWRRGWLVFVYAMVGVVIAAPQILLTLDAYSASTRNTSFVKGEVIPWRYLITLFAPDFYGNPVTRNDWFGHYAEWASYVGIVPLILAVFAVLKKRKGYIRFFAVLGCFSIFFAYPTPLNDLLYALKLPAISTSAASRIIILFSFSLAALSSFGFDELTATWKDKKRASIHTYIIGWGIVLALFWIFLIFIKPFSLDALSVARRNLLLPTATALCVLGIMAIGCIKKFKLYTVLVVLLVGISMFDSYRYASKWMPFDKREYIYPEVKSFTFLQKEIGYNRVFGNIGGESSMRFHLPLIEGYDAMYQARFGEFIKAISSGTVTPGDRSVVTLSKNGTYIDEALQLLGVRYIVHRISDGRNVWAFPVWNYGEGEMIQIYKDNDYEVYENTKSFPRAFLASSYELIQEPQHIINRLFDDTFDRRNSLILETEPEIKPSSGSGEVQIVKYSPTVVTLETTSDADKLLFLSDVYDEGWEASIDGVRTKVYRADYDFRAIAVPRGSHTIEYRYHPMEFRIGVIIAFISVIVLGITLLL